MKRSLLIPSLFALSLSVPLAGEAAGGADLAPLRQVAIQDGGRVKPLDTFARELAKRVQGAKPFGSERVAGLEPTLWLLASLAAPERDRFSLHELAEHEGLRAAVAAARTKLDHDHDLDPIDREVLELENTLVAYQGVTTGESLHVVPHPADPKAARFSLADLQSSQAADVPPLGRVRALSGAMLQAYRAGDLAGVATAARAFSSRLRELAPAVHPDAKGLRMEVHYNTLNPFRTAWVLYLAGFLVLLASFPLASRRLMRAGYAALVAGFLLNSYGMLLRVLISGCPPVTNMYETIVFVAWGGVLFALVFEAFYKTHVFAACAGALGALALILACSVPIFDGAISPLVPVLRDNMWLTVHVLTIMLGYAAFTLAMGIGHLNLGLYFLRPADVVLFKRLSLFLYRALQVGTLFLAVGTLLGGVWASYSWGRFRGWDPKETWALIALLGYLAVLHGRFAGWIKDFGMAVGAIVGYLLVLMAWYGVNYLLGTGLHSYGFGSGGYWYVGSFVAFEMLVIGAAALRPPI